MEEVIGKTKTFKNGILKRMVRVGIETFDPNKTANGFKKSFIEIEPKLACVVNSNLFQIFQTAHGCLRSSVTGKCSSRLRIRGSF